MIATNKLIHADHVHGVDEVRKSSVHVSGHVFVDKHSAYEGSKAIAAYKVGAHAYYNGEFSVQYFQNAFTIIIHGNNYRQTYYILNNKGIKMSYVDIVLIVIIGLFALFGFIGGFFKSISKLFGWIMTLLITMLITDLIATALLSINSIGKFAVGSGGGWSLYKWFLSIMPDKLKSIDMDQVRYMFIKSGEKGVKEFLTDNGGVWVSFIIPLIIKYVTNPVYLASNIENAAQAVASQLALIMYTIMIGVILFIIVRIIIAVIARLLRKFRNKNKNFLSRLGGFAVGGARGFLYSIILILILNFILSFNIAPLKKVKEQTENSVIASRLVNLTEKTTNGIENKTRSNESYKKVVKLLGYQNGSDEEISAWEDLIKSYESMQEETES